MKKYVLTVLVAVLFCAKAWAATFTDYQVGARGGNKLAYCLGIPDNYDKNSDNYPVLIFLHGMGVIWEKPGAGGQGGASMTQPYDRMIYIGPQSSADGLKDWRDKAPQIKAIIEYEKTQLRIDSERITLCGYSMGGYGVFWVVNQHPTYYCCVIPLSGGGWYKGKPFINPSNIDHLPYWLGVGAGDGLTIADVRDTVKGMRAAGAYVRYTEFNRLGHQKPRHRLGKDSNIWDWCYAQKRGTPHNYHLKILGGSVEKPSNKLGDAFFEPKTIHKITSPAPKAGKVFAGWTSAPGVGQFWVNSNYPAHKSTTHPMTGKGKFANAKALTTTFTMPANDVIITANYEIGSSDKAPVTQANHGQEIPNKTAIDIHRTKPDLVVPAMTQQAPAPGLRVKQTTSGYEGTQVHHALYLPTDWKKGKKYPVIVEYAGNRWRTSPGTVQGSNLGYGMSGGKGFIWICMPFLNGKSTANVGSWWGDRRTHQAQPTVDYCIKTVREVCRRYGGDSDAVILCGFSRGSVACNFIGLYDDEIAKLWRAFVCYSHYDGVHERTYLPGTKREHALERLKRLNGRPQFICCEAPSPGRDFLQGAKDYIESTGVKAPFTYMYTGFRQHDDAWTLRPCAARKALQAWLKDVLDE